jgi:A/G-specific adenine glycosylase
VMRFISRIFGIAGSIDLPGTKKLIHAIATEYIDQRSPGDYNQAMMEFGATVCTPVNPDCRHCIFKMNCIAFNSNMVGEIPARSPKAGIRNRYLHYLVLTVKHGGTEFIYLNKRTGNDIWKNLYDFPCLESSMNNREHRLTGHDFNTVFPPGVFEFQGVSGQYIHLLTHQKLHVMFYRFHAGKIIDLPYILVSLKDIHNYPVPKLIDRYLSQNIMAAG